MAKYSLQRALREENDWLKKQLKNVQTLLIDVFKVAHGLSDEEAAALRVAPIEALDPHDPETAERLKEWWLRMLRDYERRTFVAPRCPDCGEHYMPLME